MVVTYVLSLLMESTSLGQSVLSSHHGPCCGIGFRSCWCWIVPTMEHGMVVTYVLSLLMESTSLGQSVLSSHQMCI